MFVIASGVVFEEKTKILTKPTLNSIIANYILGIGRRKKKGGLILLPLTFVDSC